MLKRVFDSCVSTLAVSETPLIKMLTLKHLESYLSVSVITGAVSQKEFLNMMVNCKQLLTKLKVLTVPMFRE